MCYTTTLQKTASELDKRFQRKLDSELLVSFQPSDQIVGFTFPITPIIASDHPAFITAASWGLVPHWAKDDSFRKNLLNAKIETIETLPSFKDAVRNRCLVVADGFYEWKWLDAKGKKKQKYRIGLAEEEIFTMAGIYSYWQNKSTGVIFKTYSIVTTEANELMSEIHNTKKRMPVILNRKNEDDWLNGFSINEFVRPNIELIAESLND
jgi:putative SOS response-associated peptidase YedK